MLMAAMLVPCSSTSKAQPVRATSDGKSLFHHICINSRSYCTYIDAIYNRNFAGKFLIDRKGKPYAVTSDNLESQIIELLNQQEL